MSADQAPSHPSQHPGVARVGKYLMLDLLGEGAFGKVRIAVDETTGNQYAIKIMEKSHIKANELTLQVRREIAVMKAMRHPNIVNLHEVLTSSKNLYMVMDLVTGGELFDAVAASGKLPEDRTRLYFQQLVDAVDYCHSRRVYHRDLKPENLLLSSDHHTLKITDFGLSSIKAQNPSTELLHTIMGSPHYIAPEIITSAADGYEGSKVDVWAAGVILFGMLAGFLPFDEPNNRDLYNAIVHAHVKYPPHFSYDVIKLLRAMLQKDPVKRPTMAQLRNFAWFKVNYDPAILPDPRHPPSAAVAPRRKSKKAPRHRSDKAAKKKAKDGPRSSNASDAPPLAPDPAHTLDKHSESEIDSRPISELFTESHGDAVPPVADERRTDHAHAMPSADTVKNMSDQENIDPSHVNPQVSRPEEPHLQPAALKQQLISTPLASQHAQSVSTPHQHPDPHGDADAADAHVSALGSLQHSVHIMTLAQGDADPAEEEVMAASGSNAGSVAGPSANVVEPTGGSTTPHRDETGELTPRAAVKHGHNVALFTSPLSPEPVRMSSGQEERRQESLRYAEGHVPMTFSASAFESPVSLKSSASFSSPADGSGSAKPLLSPDYRSLVPQLFSAKSNAQEGEEKGMTALVLDNVLDNEESCAEGAQKDRGVDGPPDEAGEAPPCQSLDECIFKPMKSLFAPLVEKSMDRRENASMSASVFCPEFDCEADGGPQWCLDNMEVFADVEGEEDAVDCPSTARGTTSRILRDLMRQRARATEDKDVDETPKPKSIFAPLDDSLAFKLSPSAENEATTAKALKSLPQAKPCV